MELSSYGMSRERGYLSDFEIDAIALPPEFDAIVDAADTLSAILTSGRPRYLLEQLPQPDRPAFSPKPATRRPGSRWSVTRS